MNKLEFEKLVQALNFFAIKSGGKVNKMKAIKLLFFADRYHVRKYGRPVVWSTYFAMKNGPVSSEALNIENKDEQNLTSEERKEADLFLEKDEEYFFKSKKPLNEDVFSETDIEALNFAWNTFKQFDEFELANITHAYPEWRKYKERFEKNQSGREPMYFKNFFGDDVDKEFLHEKLGGDPFKSVKSPVAEIEFEEEKEARKILDC